MYLTIYMRERTLLCGSFISTASRRNSVNSSRNSERAFKRMSPEGVKGQDWQNGPFGRC